MLNFSNTVTKAEIFEALARMDSSIRICRITVGQDRKLVVAGRQGGREVIYVYDGRFWVEK